MFRKLYSFCPSDSGGKCISSKRLATRYARTCISVAFILGLIACDGPHRTFGQVAENRSAADVSHQVVERLRGAIEYEVELKQLPAFSIALVDGERTVWSDGFGYQDAKRTIRATADTVYRVGSVSKLFTDIAVMRQVEQGAMDLDASVQSYLPKFAPKNSFGSAITLRQLMSHQSGLVRESPIGHYFDPDEPTLEDTVLSLNRTQLVYPPNTRTKYSNAGIAVVGAALEAVTKHAYDIEINNALLVPLQMTNSGFVRTPKIDEHLATGMMWTYDSRRFEAPKFALGTSPAGNMYSTVNDLAKFLSCLMNEGRREQWTMLRSDSLKTMLTPSRGADGKPQSFALGFHIQELDGLQKIGHGGAVYGFSTQIEALPQRKLAVAAVAALDGANGVVGRLADYALRLMIANQDGKPLPEYERTLPCDARRVRQYVGAYQNEAGIAEVSEIAGRVFLKRGVFRNEVRARKSDGQLVTDDTIAFGTTVDFSANNMLKVGDKAYKRLQDGPPAVSPKKWEGLIGEYGWDHNTLYILEDHGKLVALIEWFYSYPLTEVSENVFAFPDFGLYHGEKLIFDRQGNEPAKSVVAAEVRFDRREVGTKHGETFKIRPIRPVSELRKEAMIAQPPNETVEHVPSNLVELKKIDGSIRLDIRYATTNNFVGEVFYDEPRAFLQKPAADAVVRIHQRLKGNGLGLLIHDAYRPWYVTKMFWEATPGDMKDFVANPAKGSRHNRGCAVDLSLFDLKTGEPIEMVAGYDEFSNRSFPLYPGGTTRQRWYRDELRKAMEADGFAVYEFEWWHFDFQDWQKYPIGNKPFSEIASP